MAENSEALNRASGIGHRLIGHAVINITDFGEGTGCPNALGGRSAMLMTLTIIRGELP